MKVYILTEDFKWDGSDGGVNVSVFESREDALEAMQDAANEWADKEADLDKLEREENDYNVSYYEDGWYDCNHICWSVMEKEVTPCSKLENRFDHEALLEKVDEYLCNLGSMDCGTITIEREIGEIVKEKVKCYDSYIDDACEHEVDEYIMCAAFEIENSDVVVRIYYGNNTQEVTDWSVRLE